MNDQSTLFHAISDHITECNLEIHACAVCRRAFGDIGPSALLDAGAALSAASRDDSTPSEEE